MRRGKGTVSSSSVGRPGHLDRRLTSSVLFALLQVLLGVPVAGAVDLTPLLAAPGDTVTLDGTSIYTVAEYALSADKTIVCNGARITSQGGPIRVSGPGVRLVVDHCHIDGTGWALLGALDGARLVLQNDTRLRGNGTNTGIYLRAASLDVHGGNINDCRWGVQMENADAALHGVTVGNTTWAVQNVAGAVTLDNGCQFSNLDPVTPGAAVSLIGSPSYPSRAPSAAIHDSVFTGFGNVVDIQPTAAQGLPPGTVEVTGSTFDSAVYSALAAVDAENLRFVRNRVVGAMTDGIYLVNSTGVIEDSQVLDSLNSGVTFWGCPNGFTVRNSLVRGSAHQGVAVVADPANGRDSRDIRIVDSTLTGNVIANVLIDDASDAVLQGTVLAGAPDMSVRLHGSPAARVIGALILDSHGGLELKNGAAVNASLSIFTRHDRYGAFAYQNGTATFSHCAFHANGLDPATADYAVTLDTGARVTLERCTLGPAGERGLYNNAGTTCIAAHDYWDDPSGPRLQSGGGGAGAVIGATKTNGSQVEYEPFLAAPPLDIAINDAFELTADTSTFWTSDVGVVVQLDGAPGITTVSRGLVAVLRLRDTSTLTMPPPPVGTSPDGVIAVWAEFNLVSRAAGGTLRIHTVGDGASMALSRLDTEGQWTSVSSTWDATTSEIVYAPADARSLQGIFAFGDGQGCPTARACLDALLTSSPCTEPLPPKLAKAITRRLRSAITKLTKAAAATKPAKVTRFVQQARKSLFAIERLAGKATKLMTDAVSTECRDALLSALAPARQRLEAGAY